MFTRTVAVLGTIVVLIIAYVAWTRYMQRPAMAPAAEAPAPMPESAPEAGSPEPGSEPPHVESATDPGVAWKVPARWTDRGPGSIRLATYVIPGAAGEAQCAVYYFGAGQGGPVELNLERWRGEFRDAAEDAPLNFDAPGARVTEIALTGTYLAHASMTQGMGGEALEMPKWALLGAIAEGPNGSVFFKLTGPKAIVKSAAKDFDAMLKSIHRI